MSVDSASDGCLRPFRPTDLPAALALQASAYAPALRDASVAFASRLDIAEGCCRVAERDGELCGYILAPGIVVITPARRYRRAGHL